MISDKYKCIYIHIPKTGGSSVEIALDKPQNCWDRQNNVWKQHCSIHQLRDIYNVAIDKYYKFTVVRNPWSRAVSDHAWFTKETSNFYNLLKQATLKDYLQCTGGYEKVAHLDNPTGRGDHFYTQHSYIMIDGKCTMDYIIRFENFQQDFNKVCDKIGISRQQLPHKNKTKHKHYTEYYDDETRQIVAEIYAKDIEYFGYEFGE